MAHFILVFIGLIINLHHTYGETFDHDFDYSHSKSGERFSLKGNGTLASIAYLDDEPSITRIVCTPDLVFIALKDLSYGSKLSPGQLVVGSHVWGCKSEVNGITRPGIYRKIVKVKTKKKSLELVTEKAKIFHAFKEATLEVHYTPGDWSGISEEERDEDIKHRMKRDAGDKSSTAAKLWPVILSYRKDDLFSVDINYDTTFKKAASTYTREEPDWWTIDCSDCFAYFKTGVSFVLQIDESGIQYFMLQLHGNLKYNADVGLTTKKSWTNSVSFNLPETPAKVEFPLIPLLPSSIPTVPDLNLAIKADVTLEGTVDVASETTNAVTFGLDQSSNLTITLKKTGPDDDFVFEMYFNENDIAYHDTVHQIDGDLKAKVTVAPKFDFDASISWGYQYRYPETKEEPLFEETFSAPFTVKIEPPINILGSYDPGMLTLCLTLSHQGKMVVDIDKVTFHLKVWGAQKWPKEGENGDINAAIMHEEYSLWDPTTFSIPQCAGNSCCKVKCSGDYAKGVNTANTAISFNIPISDYKTLSFEIETSRSDANMDFTVEAMVEKILRSSVKFQGLKQWQGSDIVFVSEEKSDSWCGVSTRSCVDCTNKVKGNLTRERCADRLCNANMRNALTKLVGLMKIEWPNRKLRIEEMYDEPTFQNQQGRHGPKSQHYEGRAAWLTITNELTEDEMANPPPDAPPPDQTKEVMDRLGQLAVCAGFPYVQPKKQSSGEKFIHVAHHPVREVPYSKRLTKIHMESLQKIDIARCNEFPDHFWPLQLGQQKPSKGTPGYLCGKIDGRITRMQPELTRKFYYYQFDDVDFKDEERNYAWSFRPFRPNVDCTTTDALEETNFGRCADRTMTGRLALCIRRLAYLVKQEWPNYKLQVREAWDEENSEHKHLWGDSPEKSLHYEGRAAKLSLITDGKPDEYHPADLGRLTSLAMCASCDVVRYINNDFIEVFAKKQTEDAAIIVVFSGDTLTEVSPPFNSKDCDYPAELNSEMLKPSLFDGDSADGDKWLSAHWKAKDFKHPDHGCFRIDPRLVECLEDVSIALEKDLKSIVSIPGSAYKTASENAKGLDKRHAQQKYRYQAGQAVELKMNNTRTTPNDVKLIGIEVMRTCLPLLLEERRGLGIGIHKDHLYVDLRPLPSEDMVKNIDLWKMSDASGKEVDDIYKKLNETADQLILGGPAIIPSNYDRACEKPTLGEANYYFNIPVRDSRSGCSSSTPSDWCKDPQNLKARTKVVEDIYKEILKKTKLNIVNDPTTYKAFTDLLKTVCHKCMGSGEPWKKKVEGFAKVLNFYKAKAGNPFGNLTNKLSFYNRNNKASRVKNIACKDYLCFDKTALGAMISTIMTRRFRPDETKSVEEMVYDPSENPLPIEDMGEQFLAAHVHGVVRVYIEKTQQDISALWKVLKILLVYNDNVTMVEFHITQDVVEEDIVEKIERKTEMWAISSCPKWSRYAIAPIKFIKISRNRLKRSIDDHEASRPHLDPHIHWEAHWLEKLTL